MIYRAIRANTWGGRYWRAGQLTGDLLEAPSHHFEPVVETVAEVPVDPGPSTLSEFTAQFQAMKPKTGIAYNPEEK